MERGLPVNEQPQLSINLPNLLEALAQQHLDWQKTQHRLRRTAYPVTPKEASILLELGCTPTIWPAEAEGLYGWANSHGLRAFKTLARHGLTVWHIVNEAREHGEDPDLLTALRQIKAL